MGANHAGDTLEASQNETLERLSCRQLKRKRGRPTADGQRNALRSFQTTPQVFKDVVGKQVEVKPRSRSHAHQRLLPLLKEKPERSSKLD